MPSIITNKFKEANIQNFINSIIDDNIFVSFGASESWINENVPPTPIDNFNLLKTFFYDQLYMKKVNVGNISNIARLYRWLPNTRYQKYSPTEQIENLCEPKVYSTATATAIISNGSVTQIQVNNSGSGYETAPSIVITGGGGSGATATAIVVDGMVVSIVVTSGGSGYTSAPTVTISPPRPDISNTTFTVNPYYVVTDDLNVYVCIDNNNLGLSTIKPTFTNTNQSDDGTTLADGYTWKYIYKIPQTDAEKFMTPNWFPVKIYQENDGSDNWNIQYNSLINNRIHGRDPVYSLNANALMIKVRVSGNEGNQIIASNDYRKISLIKNPVAVNSIYTAAGYSSNTITLNSSHDISDTNALWYPTIGKKIIILEGPGRGQIRTITNHNSGVVTVDKNWDYPLSTSSKYGILLSTQVSNLCTVLSLTSVSGTFIEDETANQSSSGANGKIVYFDSANNKLYLSKVNGTFTTGSQIQQGAATATVSAIKPPDAANYYCDVLFTENRKKILRYSDQIEDIKIVIQF